MLIHTVWGAIQAVLVLPMVNTRLRRLIIGHWARQLLAIMQIQVIAKGNLPPPNLQGVMFVANHISWVDIHALNTLCTVRFIAKSEIRAWPVFGWFAARANTLFIDRSRKQDAAKIVHVVKQSLLAGDSLCYFPEGTTTDGREIKPFKASIAQAAVDLEAVIWPFSIRYPAADGSANVAMAYYGDIELMTSIGNVLAQQKSSVEIHFLTPISTKGRDRRSVIQEAYQAIAADLGLKA